MPASEKTEVRFLYDEDNLYVGARCWDSDPTSLTAHELKQDFDSPQEDVIAVLIDSLHDGSRGSRSGRTPREHVAMSRSSRTMPSAAWTGMASGT